MADNLDLLSSKFVFENTNIYSLSIRHQPDGYSFSVLDDNGIVVAIKHVVCDKNYDLGGDPLLNLHFKSIKYIECSHYAIIPDALLSDKSKLFLPLEKDKIAISGTKCCTPISSVISEKVNVVFVSNDKQLPSPLKQLMQNGFEILFTHEMALLINMATSVEERIFMLCEVMANALNIIAVNNDKMVMCTSYAVNSELDILYYVMEAYHVLNFDPNSVKLFFIGDMVTFPFLNEVKKFVRFCSSIPPANLSADIIIPNPEYFTLISNSI